MQREGWREREYVSACMEKERYGERCREREGERGIEREREGLKGRQRKREEHVNDFANLLRGNNTYIPIA